MSETTTPESAGLKPADMKILVLEPHYWGKGDTMAEALAKMKKAGGSCKKYLAFIVHPDSHVDCVSGSICFPEPYAPKEILRKGIPKEA